MGARVIAPALAEEVVLLWLDTPFDGGRHARRIEQLSAIELEECEREGPVPPGD